MTVVGPARKQPMLSLCMLVKDEELLIAHALESVGAVVDEIIVVDTGSTDRTREIAARYGAKIYSCDLSGGFSRGRNLSLQHATGQWVLVLDGDETIAARDAARLPALIAAASAAAYWLTVHNYSRSLDLLCDWHPNRGAYPDEETRSGCPGHSRFRVVRLFRRTPSIRYDDSLSSHCNPLASLRAAGTEIRDSSIAIHHFQHLKGGEAFISRKQRERLRQDQLQVARCPTDALAHLNIGRTLFSLGRDAEAVRHLEHAVRLGDDPDRALLSLGIVLVETGAYAEAAEHLETALQRRPDDADSWTVLGMAYHGLERHDEAAAALQRALTLHPLHPVALNSCGVVLLDLEREQEAAELFRRALDVLPGFEPALDNLRALHRRNERPAVEIRDEPHDV